jgi:excisionase family DNA binding protein
MEPRGSMLTPEEAAQYLNCTKQVVLDACRDGGLVCKRISERVIRINSAQFWAGNGLPAKRAFRKRSKRS